MTPLERKFARVVDNVVMIETVKQPTLTFTGGRQLRTATFSATIVLLEQQHTDRLGAGHQIETLLMHFLVCYCSLPVHFEAA